MSRYIVKYTQLYTAKVCEGDIHSNYSAALNEAIFVKSLDVAKVIVILEDKEGSDHIDNAGKFFLKRIIK